MTLEELEKKIGVLEDIEAIKKLHREYIYALASQQWDDMLDCFTENAETDLWDHGRCSGKKEIEAQFKGELANMVKPTDGHFAGQPIINVDGERAIGQWIMYIFIPESERLFVQGKYDAKYIKIDGEWKFSFNAFVAAPVQEVEVEENE